MILIITNEDDMHADIIESKFFEKGANFFRLNLDEYPSEYKTHIELLNTSVNGSIKRVSNGHSTSIRDIHSVWLRKPGEFSFLSKNLSKQELLFSRQETEHALFSLLYSLDCFWMSHPLSLRGSQWKGEQLQRAVSYGFKVPRSLITTDPLKVTEFYQQCPNGMIFKVMSNPFLASDAVNTGEREADGLATTLITPEMLDELDSVRELPSHFQEYIAKQYELRVTVIGKRVFAAKIHSQDDERTKTDFRDFSAEILYEKADLSDELAQQCVDYVHSYGLNYGAIDLIVTPEDEVVFLENNPNGQFWFIEQLVPELRMMDAVAELLIQGNAS